MNFSVKVNSFIIFILCSLVSCEAKYWLCPVESTNKSVHEYICTTRNSAIDDQLDDKSCHLISDDFNLPTNNSEVTELKIKHCAFNVISSCLKSYENVISLDISNLEYDSLDSLHLNQQFLKKLNVSNNKLTKMPIGFLANIPEIIEVDLSYNKLFIIDASTFEGANKLTTIHLSHNEIRSIVMQTFSQLKDLEYVDLSNNQLNGIFHTQNGIFDNNTKLEVHLESNPDDHNIPVIPFATSVYCSWGQLEIITTNNLDKRLRIIPNSPNEGYFRTSSEYTELHCNERSFVGALNISVQPNQIENVRDLFECFGSLSSLRKLDLSGNFVGSINSTELMRFPGLNILDLSDTHLDGFDIAVLRYLRFLSELNIAQNGLKRLENAQLLSQFNSLREFDIADNKLENIPEIIDSLSSSVGTLDLSGNFVGEITRINFEKLDNLEAIALRNTSLQFSGENPFEQNTKLTYLDISNNNLSEWSFTAMAKSLKKLGQFYAASCQIKDIFGLVKQFGPILLDIDLSNNHLPELNTSTFRSTRLFHINFSNMNMTKFKMDNNWPVLYTLNVSSNQLTELNITMHQLETIDIEGNYLTELTHFTQSQLPFLNALNVANNNFPCAYLVQLLERIKVEWPNLELIGDSYKQKHGEDCHSDILKPKMTPSKWIYSAAFVVPSAVLLAIFSAAVGFVFYRRSFKRTNKEAEMTFRLGNVRVTVDQLKLLQQRELPQVPGCEDHIYEEIGHPTVDDRYDRLDFIGQPKSINDNSDRYETVNSSNQ